MNLSDIDALVRKVCPIDGINSDGVIWFSEFASEEQKEKARIIVNQNIGVIS